MISSFVSVANSGHLTRLSSSFHRMQCRLFFRQRRCLRFIMREMAGVANQASPSSSIIDRYEGCAALWGLRTVALADAHRPWQQVVMERPGARAETGWPVNACPFSSLPSHYPARSTTRSRPI